MSREYDNETVIDLKRNQSGFDAVLGLVQYPEHAKDWETQVLTYGSGKDCYLFMLNNDKGLADNNKLMQRISLIGSISVIRDMALYLMLDHNVEPKNLIPLIEKVKDIGNAKDCYYFYNKLDDSIWHDYSSILLEKYPDLNTMDLPQYFAKLNSYMQPNHVLAHNQTTQDLQDFFQSPYEERPKIKSKCELTERKEKVDKQRHIGKKIHHGAEIDEW